MNILGITLGKRSQLLLRIAGYIALGLVSFLFALQMTFPYSRVKDRVAEALSAKYDVVIGSVERGWLPGKMILKNVSLKTRPTQPNQTPNLLYIKQISLDLSVLALASMKTVLDIEATIGTGTLTGTVTCATFTCNKDSVKVAFESDSLPGANLPFKEYVGLPVVGRIALDLEAELRLVRRKVDWTKVVAHLQLECPSGCTVGDGKTKIRPVVTRPNQAEFVKDGIEFNKLQLDKFEARLEVKKGVAKIVKWNVPSKDGEVYLEFEAKLEPLLNDSQVTGCLRYNGSADLEKRDYRTLTQLRTLGAPLGPDKLFHIRLTGPLRQVKRLAQVCGEAAAKAGNSGSGSSGGSGGGGPNERRPPPSSSADDVKPAEVAPPAIPTPIVPAPPPPTPAPGTTAPGVPPGAPPPGTPDAGNPNGGVTGGSAVPAPPPPPMEGAAGSGAAPPFEGRIE